MIDVTIAVMMVAGTGLISIGGAYGAVKQAMNGTKERVKVLEIENKDTADRLARIETKIDILVTHVER